MYKVAIVVDEQFGQHLLDLTQEAYVWIVESEANKPWIERAWAAHAHEADPLLRGVTSFMSYPDESLDTQVLRVAEMVDEHHGEHAHQPPWSVLEIRGTGLTDALSAELRGYGVSQFEEITGGFLASRTEPAA